MRATVRTVVALLFIAVVLGIGLTVLYFGTSSGIINGGTGSSLGGATRTLPYYAQIGWLRNTAPWPITINSITTNAINTSTAPVAYIERSRSNVAAKADAAPIWTQTSPNPPYDMAANSLRYLAWSVDPNPGQIGAFTSFTVNYTGPLGLKFHKTFTGTSVVASSSTLPPTLLSDDPSTDTSSLDSYISLLSAALVSRSDAEMAVIMGNGATAADAKAFFAREKGYTSKFVITATPAVGNLKQETLTYYHGSTKLAPIVVVWADFRWTVTRS